MATMKVHTYGEGGFDPSKPNGNLLSVEEIEVADVEVDTSSITQVRDAVASLDVPQSIRDALDSVLARVEDATVAGNLNTDPPASA